MVVFLRAMTENTPDIVIVDQRIDPVELARLALIGQGETLE
jgi:hypothetical protein